MYAEETHCWRCGGYVDQTLPAGHRAARSVDHVVPLSRGGDPLDRDGLRLAHHSCNSGAGNRPTTTTTTMVSRRW